MESILPKVTLCLPSYKTMHPVTSFCVTMLARTLEEEPITTNGDAFIAHARNDIATRFLATDSEWSLWLDDDMIPPIGRSRAGWFNNVTGFQFPAKFSGMHTTTRLLSAGKTFVGGLYFGRSSKGKPMYGEGCGSVEEARWVRKNAPIDEVRQTKWIASGCMLVHRQVFLAISERWPHLKGNWFSSSEHDLVEGLTTLDDAFEKVASPDQLSLAEFGQLRMLVKGLKHRYQNNSPVGMGEDIQFCVRAAQVGHPPHVDFGLVAAHIGGFAYGPQTTSE
jgi:hypothetical protein